MSWEWLPGSVLGALSLTWQAWTWRREQRPRASVALWFEEVAVDGPDFDEVAAKVLVVNHEHYPRRIEIALLGRAPVVIDQEIGAHTAEEFPLFLTGKQMQGFDPRGRWRAKVVFVDQQTLRSPPATMAAALI